MKTEICDAHNSSDLRRVAEILHNGGMGAFPYGGVYGLFCDRDNPKAINRIFDVKGREDPKIGATAEPLDIVTRLARVDNFKKEHLLRMWKNTPALGVILPAADNGGCVTEGTILTFWAKYPPLRALLVNFKELGGFSLAATSANLSGEGTHWLSAPLIHDFDGKVNFIARDDGMPRERNISTTVLRWTGEQPTLFREGNVRLDELRGIIRRISFPELFIGIENVDYKPAKEARIYKDAPMLVPF